MFIPDPALRLTISQETDKKASLPQLWQILRPERGRLQFFAFAVREVLGLGLKGLELGANDLVSLGFGLGALGFN